MHLHKILGSPVRLAIVPAGCYFGLLISVTDGYWNSLEMGKSCVYFSRINDSKYILAFYVKTWKETDEGFRLRNSLLRDTYII